MSEENQKVDIIVGADLTIAESVSILVEHEIISEVEKIAKGAIAKADEVKKVTPKEKTHKRTGRPSKFKQSMIKDAEKLASIFCPSMQDLASFWDVGVASVDRWIRKNPEFRNALTRGKNQSKRRLTEKLFDLAMEGNLHALIFTLTNKFADEWTDKGKVNINNTISQGVNVTQNNPSEIRKHVDGLDDKGRQNLVKIISRVEKEVLEENGGKAK